MFCRMTRQLTEGAAIATARIALGDEEVARVASEELSYEAKVELAHRHPRQVESIFEAATKD